MLLKISGKGRPYRLFVAGLHGAEWKDTSDILLSMAPPATGMVAVMPVIDRSEYLSTLDPEYYHGRGASILEAIEQIDPDVYVELHSYSAGNRAKLTDRGRIDRVGVPGFSVLEEGVLIGSVSPHIRRDHLSPDTLCLSFEIQRSNERSRAFATRILDVVKKCESRKDFLNYVLEHYPVQAKKAIENYKRFYGL
ncbi:MAG: DUF2119 domain-containing protein [Euryarchaeota archaeon]|nr:DUF2119 domain-containing protein [Euryarchaeota archaeon]